jgi:uncharacterized membrane protein YbhN (UPF0104 family)
VRRQAGAFLGAAMVAVALGFCIATFVRERDRIDDALAAATPGWLVLAVVLAAAAMISVALGWARCLAVVGAPNRTLGVLRWYFVGELGKYVPGTIWPILGRAELAARGGAGRVAGYRSVLLSLAAWYGAAVFPVAVAAAHPRVQQAAVTAARKASRGRVEVDVLPWRTLVGLIASYLPSWLLIGAVTAAVTVGYGGDPGWQAPTAAVLAWVCGFLAVPVPAGAGVREAVFVATSGLDPGLALTVAITSRLAFVGVDLVAAAVSTPGLRSRGALRAHRRDRPSTTIHPEQPETTPVPG